MFETVSSEDIRNNEDIEKFGLFYIIGFLIIINKIFFSLNQRISNIELTINDIAIKLDEFIQRLIAVQNEKEADDPTIAVDGQA